MANEAVIVELLGWPKGEPISYTVANGTAISAGTLLAVTDPKTAVATSTTGEVFAGIAAADKVANDGAVKLAVYTRGIFDLKASTDALTLGAILATSGANLVRAATEAEIAAGKAVGKLIETASASEVVQVILGGN